MTNESKTIVDLLKEFSKNTITGQLSACYKIVNKNKTDVSPVVLYKNMAPMCLMEYANSLYKSLILRNDEYVTKNFDDMKKVHDHSEVCLLHILFNTWLVATQMIKDDVIKCDSDYDIFMNSCENELDRIFNKLGTHFKKLTKHKCTGIDIKTCDPNEKLFCVIK